jgi:hypothetical protein
MDKSRLKCEKNNERITGLAVAAAFLAVNLFFIIVGISAVVTLLYGKIPFVFF